MSTNSHIHFKQLDTEELTVDLSLDKSLVMAPLIAIPASIAFGYVITVMNYYHIWIANVSCFSFAAPYAMSAAGVYP